MNTRNLLIYNGAQNVSGTPDYDNLRQCGIIATVRNTINDKLRDFIIWAIECYDVAASPPAVNYSKHVDPSYRDDVNGYSRAYLLRLSIDVKYALNDLLADLPHRRASVLLGWLTSTERYYWHNLTYKQQSLLKRDKKTLRMKINAASPQKTPNEPGSR